MNLFETQINMVLRIWQIAWFAELVSKYKNAKSMLCNFSMDSISIALGQLDSRQKEKVFHCL